MKSRFVHVMFLCAVLIGTSLPAYLHAQSSDESLNNVEQILRYMKGANYSEEDLIRRVAWSDKLVGEMNSYRPTPVDRDNFVRLLDISVNHYKDENTRVRILLRAITTLDPLVQKYFPQWIVQDEPMILEIMRKIRDNRDDLRDAEAVDIADRVLTGKARMRVVQSPKDADNLIGIIIEKARAKSANNVESAGYITNMTDPDYEDYRVVGRKSLQTILTPDLYDRVVNRYGYSHFIETGIIQPNPYVAQADISVPFGGGFLWTLESDKTGETNGIDVQRARIRAGFELKIGNEWVNLPFLYGPQWNTMFVYWPSHYEYVKIGPSLPFTWGDKSLNENFPLLKPRKLNGTFGAYGEYFRQLSNISGSPGEDADGIGAAAFVSFGLAKLGNKKITDVNGLIINGDGARNALSNNTEQNLDQGYNRFYYLTSTATLYYWRDLNFLMDGLRISAGAGYQKVNEARRKSTAIDGTSGSGNEITDSVRVLDTFGTLDAYVKLAYEHRGITQYGLSLQYFNGSVMGEAYLNLFSWMRAEVKYSRVVFRDPEKWEYNELIVPGIRMSWAF